MAVVDARRQAPGLGQLGWQAPVRVPRGAGLAAACWESCIGGGVGRAGRGVGQAFNPRGLQVAAQVACIAGAAAVEVVAAGGVAVDIKALSACAGRTTAAGRLAAAGDVRLSEDRPRTDHGSPLGAGDNGALGNLPAMVAVENALHRVVDLANRHGWRRGVCHAV